MASQTIPNSPNDTIQEVDLTKWIVGAKCASWGIPLPEVGDSYSDEYSDEYA